MFNLSNLRMFRFVAYLTLTLLALNATKVVAETSDSPSAVIKTNLGTIHLTLFDNKAPISVQNFIKHAESGFYNGTIFHRVISGFMIQGGGFEPGLIRKNTGAPIKNEAKAFVPNSRGTIAMARTSNPDSATSQFFINVKNNSFLNKSTSNPGYAVFGKVTQGMSIVDRIASTPTGQSQGMKDVPRTDVLIESISIKHSDATKQAHTGQQ